MSQTIQEIIAGMEGITEETRKALLDAEARGIDTRCPYKHEPLVCNYIPAESIADAVKRQKQFGGFVYIEPGEHPIAQTITLPDQDKFDARRKEIEDMVKAGARRT